MVILSDVQSSNSLIASTLPLHLVAVFVGATSGIGRSQDAGNRIITECKTLNPQGEYIFVKADVSLIRVADEVCGEIKAKENAINILFLSAGLASMDRRGFYSRLRFIANLLPLLRRASAIRRVVTVAAGALEGPLDPNDFSARRVPLNAIRGHLNTLTSLGLESVARTAPEVSFVHDFPGAVNTPLFSRMEGILGVVMRAYIYFLGRWICVPMEESGERHLYLATSARYAPASTGTDGGSGVPLEDGVDMARETTGEVRSGVYSVGWDGESASPAVQKLLAGYRDKGMVEEIWQHTEKEFRRITEQNEVPYASREVGEGFRRNGGPGK